MQQGFPLLAHEPGGVDKDTKVLVRATDTETYIDIPRTLQSLCSQDTGSAYGMAQALLFFHTPALGLSLFTYLGIN